MKWLVGILAVVLGIGLAWWLMQVVASESGEVVVVTTTDAGGGGSETRLWVVDHDGWMWLRAGNPGSAWLRRLQEQPQVTVERDGVTGTFVAEPHPELRAEVNRLMNEKYGWADDYVSFWFGRDDATPIRLAPATASAGAASGGGG